MPGDVFDRRYEIDALLGEGGNGAVFSARDRSTNRRVAVKLLKPEDSSGYSREVASRFAREVTVLQELHNPHTVELLEHGQSPDGLLYMTFEEIPGRDLADVLRDAGQLPPNVVVHILLQVLDSLAAAHRTGLLHRDIKPENIRVFERGGDPWSVKVLDFGIARPIDPTELAITRAGELVGTPRYMSPEQLRARPLSRRPTSTASGWWWQIRRRPTSGSTSARGSVTMIGRCWSARRFPRGVRHLEVLRHRRSGDLRGRNPPVVA